MWPPSRVVCKVCKHLIPMADCQGKGVCIPIGQGHSGAGEDLLKQQQSARQTSDGVIHRCA